MQFGDGRYTKTNRAINHRGAIRWQQNCRCVGGKRYNKTLKCLIEKETGHKTAMQQLLNLRDTREVPNLY